MNDDINLIVYNVGGIIQGYWSDKPGRVRIVQVDNDPRSVQDPGVSFDLEPFDFDDLPMESALMDIINKAAVCPNEEHVGETDNDGDPDPDGPGHGICPRCKVRPIACNPDDGEPYSHCLHCIWEDEEPA